MEQSLHASSGQLAEPLAGINILITGGMGPGLHQRLMQSGILPVITVEEDPDVAVTAMLSNRLVRLPVTGRYLGHEQNESGCFPSSRGKDHEHTLSDA